ncbi:MobF family relaxase [Arthrobacter woluwensis]|uniref:Conjugative relaxase domain-containing protein, TrwC/TraI family n=1 Tax=Arthrobacter woluwensis TaxID=156980 RepID=A0A1H4I7D7_9MICC|nr:MobF family relaxase [Arthrobacter woluwensis]SEB29810.1 conjugative relaxase domain-containing protein, TrwC/TraI family [Arthrobacter woluwensis]
MTVSIGRISIDYYLEQAAGDGAQTGTRDLSAYYTESQAPAGRWRGKGLVDVHLEQGAVVEKIHAKRLYEELIDPMTLQPLGRRPIKEQKAGADTKTPAGAPAKPERKPVAGFDLTFSPPKSISALWALADTHTQAELYRAHREAMDEVLNWAEDNVIQTRAGHGGVAKVAATGMIASEFDHWDSRAGDPQLHTHVVIANRVKRVSDGGWGTLDSYTLHRNVVALSEMYNSRLFDRVGARVGAVAELRLKDPETGSEFETIAQAIEGLNFLDEDPRQARVELAGVPQILLEEFSTRISEINRLTEERKAQYLEATGREPTAAMVLKWRGEATLASREPKDKDRPLSLPEKMAGWRERALNIGVNPSDMVREAVGRDVTFLTAADLTPDLTRRLAGLVLQDAAQRRTTFTRANLIASTERLLRGVRVNAMEERIKLQELIVTDATEQAVSLTPARMGQPEGEDAFLIKDSTSVFQTPTLYTAQETLDTEQYLISRLHAEAHGIAEAHELLTEFRTKGGHALSGDQHQAAAAVLSSNRAVDAIIGPAGTGKTTTMRAVREAWESVHGRVVGLAPSAVAAAVLAEELDTGCENVAKWLYETIGEGALRRMKRVTELEERLARAETRAGRKGSRAATRAELEHLRGRLAQECAEQAKFTLRDGDLLILDEASMISTADLLYLNRQAEAAGAKILMVGDPAQLESVDAGGFLGWMERHEEAAWLDTVWRFTNDWEGTASLKLRSGDLDVIKTYQEAGRIIPCGDGGASEQAYRAWARDTAQDLTRSLLIAGDNLTVKELNQRAQQDLVAEGRVDVENTVPLRTGFAGVGDLLLARTNNRRIIDETGHFVKNGTRLFVTTIQPDGAVTATRSDTGAALTLDATYLAEAVELGYACTAHRSQGVTVATAHTVVTPGQPREQFYVAMTRGRNNNTAYVALREEEPDSPDTWGMMHTIQSESAGEIIAGILRNATAEKTAHEVREAEHGYANDLGRILHELDYTGHAARATAAAHWVHTHLPEQASELLNHPDWPDLITADIATAIPDGPPNPGPSIAQLAAAVRNHTASPVTGENRILTALSSFPPMTEEQQRVKDLLQHKAEERLTVLTHETLTERPTWWEAAEETLGAEEARRRLPELLAWRAVAEVDTTTPWGPPPRPNSYAHRFYTHIKDSIPVPSHTEDDAWENIDEITRRTDETLADVAATNAEIDAILGWDDAPEDPASTQAPEAPEQDSVSWD